MRNDLFRLDNKTCIVTGGAGLLGKYHAEAILEAGGEVFLTDILEDQVKDVADDLSEKYKTKKVTGFYMDVTNKPSVDKFIDTVFSNRSVDILINNAAKDPKVKKDGLNYSRFENMSVECWKEGLDVSLNGTFLVTQAVINKMLEKDQGGVILNIASDLSVIAPDNRIYNSDEKTFSQQSVKPVFYSASKYAIVGMTKYLAAYFAEKNIRVNSISPGGAFNNHPDQFVTNISNLIPMKRMASVDEYKGAVIFACSKASSYMTGHNLILDGGRSIW